MAGGANGLLIWGCQNLITFSFLVTCSVALIIKDKKLKTMVMNIFFLSIKHHILIHERELSSRDRGFCFSHVNSTVMDYSIAFTYYLILVWAYGRKREKFFSFLLTSTLI